MGDYRLVIVYGFFWLTGKGLFSLFSYIEEGGRFVKLHLLLGCVL